MSPRAGTERYRFTVPDKDTSVVEWIAEQENLGASLRVVIREYIERNGVTDATCRPVAQLPRRGRPPADQVEQTVHDTSDEQAGQAVEQGPSAAARPTDQAPARRKPAARPAPVEPVEQDEDDLDEVAEPADGQYDINDLFSRSR